MYTICVEDMSLQRRNDQTLFELLDKWIQILEQDWKFRVIGVVTDAGGDAKRARWLLLKKYPHMIILDCWAHQVCM